MVTFLLMAKPSPIDSEQPISRSAGRRLKLSSSRSLVMDMLYFHRKMPTVAHCRSMNLGKLVELRQQSSRPVAWSLLFIKAFAKVALQHPQLRQTYMSTPWPHLYESAANVVNLAIARDYNDEQWLFFAPIQSPENHSLQKLQELLEDYRSSPVEKVFATQLRIAKLPLLVRRALWWLRLHISGKKRVKRLGTFGLTTLAGEGATIIDPRAPTTSILTYGPTDEDGRCDVTIVYDHRIMDGRLIAQALRELEKTLTQEIANEYLQLIETVDRNS